MLELYQIVNWAIAIYLVATMTIKEWNPFTVMGTGAMLGILIWMGYIAIPTVEDRMRAKDAN